MDPFQLAYVSRAAYPVDDRFLDELKTAVAGRNKRLGITGVLLHSNGHFLEFLESDASVLGEVFKLITSNERFADVDCLVLGRATERTYESWSMGVLDLQNDGRPIDRAAVAAALRVALSARCRHERHRGIVQAIELFRDNLLHLPKLPES